MRRLKECGKGLLLMVTVGVAFAWLPAHVLAQATPVKPESLVGKYEGTASLPDGNSMPLHVELRLEKGAIVGTGNSPQGAFVITGATISGDKVTLAMDFSGMAGTLTGTPKGDRHEGTWTLGEMSGSYALARVAAAPPATAPAPPAAGAEGAKPAAAAAPADAGADPLTCDWDGAAGDGDMTRNFTLRLKLDGEKVTGDIGSNEGGAPLTSGSWKEGTLTVSFEFAGMGTLTMIGALKEGKLVGSIDVAGQAQLPWAAVKRPIAK